MVFNFLFFVCVWFIGLLACALLLFICLLVFLFSFCPVVVHICLLVLSFFLWGSNFVLLFHGFFLFFFICCGMLLTCNR